MPQVKREISSSSAPSGASACTPIAAALGPAIRCTGPSVSRSPCCSITPSTPEPLIETTAQLVSSPATWPR
jgi:hypothetical protein